MMGYRNSVYCEVAVSLLPELLWPLLSSATRTIFLLKEESDELHGASNIH